MTTVVSFRADDSLVAALDQLARATHRDRPYHLRQALAQYLERQSWHVAAIDEGVADADAGHLLEHAAIEGKWGLA
ncbi:MULTISPECIES: CopG family ribbon-helix-helix protein [Pseudomonas]|uniref:CopG family ribbon-helix-helix protein n=1 Tax=Pseudomonas nitroreducens TaxID=46680 RepID=A0A6G6IPA0_PSENT|nr:MULTISPECIES: CopG family ribbon-helix-helix protein [Pseudomonas]MBG6288638.1 CopG family ribbon-helix-helix protein [Pseudomonas nitroreducens]MCE4067920.1 CopG family ribbon-helix-helix protein [Pseudomonas nitritireducens]MCE4077109.1 CopG family ribbon-helix-helix protein [Pseudomonas nitroreducens]MCJ1879074.1 CopG family ribbon-helix-helix protein [Pseudomonas nitroreducens]MCJ1896112.1 CopG family ribbon-helix-helix protein [Pseudomonas nitroreducens]